jgi:hypothetical protein
MSAEDAGPNASVPARILSFESPHGMVTLVLFSGSQAAFKEPVRHCLRDEAKEVRPDARPQARKNRRCIRWNTLRIFSGRERRRWLRIVRRSRKVNVGQAPRVTSRNHDRSTDTTPGSTTSTTTSSPMAMVADLTNSLGVGSLDRGADSGWVAVALLERPSRVGSVGGLSAKPGDSGLFVRSAAHRSIFHRASYSDPGGRYS